MFFVVLPHDTESILVATAAEKELIASIGMEKESCWADDADDAAFERWTKIIRKGKKQVFFEEQFGIDFESRTSRIEGPTNPIGRQSNNTESGQAQIRWRLLELLLELRVLKRWKVSL
ncbi:hypothetical protein Bca52824_033103 [Brassica carinata]|uniref:DUF287 domain-containing protein n=1 Tax=Brassica carinata TaxID=52824 RepID=A0A8X7SED2_BRACI|nr:hypothetical protein Bca52824_033103 [Brassica carinata]